MQLIVAFILGLIGGCWASNAKGNDLQAAVVDVSRFPSTDRPYLYYLTSASVPEAQRAEFHGALFHLLASSSQQVIAEHCIPARVTETLFRIDTRAFQWSAAQMFAVAGRNPYRRSLVDGPLLVTSAPWLLVQLADTTEGDAYYRLLYGTSEVDRAKFLKTWQANENPAHQISFAEDESGVSVMGDRWLLNYDNGIRTDVWGTLDFFKSTKSSDPTNNLLYTARDWLNKPNHNGEEWIAGIPKVSLQQNKRGRLQAYLLANSRGIRVEEAPPRLVRDSQLFRRHGAITNVGSCIGCHKQGLNSVSVDAVRRYIEAGARIQTYNVERKTRVEALVLQNISTLIERANAEYATGCEITSGLTPEQVSDAVIASVHWYDEEVTPAQAAIELYCEVEDLQLALAWRDLNYKDLNALQAKLAQGIPIPRTAWEDIYTDTALTIRVWKEGGTWTKISTKESGSGASQSLPSRSSTAPVEPAAISSFPSKAERSSAQSTPTNSSTASAPPSKPKQPTQRTRNTQPTRRGLFRGFGRR